MKCDVRRIDYAKDPGLFMRLTDAWDVEEFPSLWTIGDTRLLGGDLLALFCSRKCPGRIVRKSHDFAEDLRAGGTPVIGGFHTAVEKMCLEVLVKGTQPIVICLARGIQRMRLTPDWAAAVEEGRLLVASPFSAKHRRATKATAEARNRFVSAAAQRLFFLHAAANSNTLAFAEELLSDGREIETFDLTENSNLLEIGAGRYNR